MNQQNQEQTNQINHLLQENLKLRTKIHVLESKVDVYKNLFLFFACRAHWVWQVLARLTDFTENISLLTSITQLHQLTILFVKRLRNVEKSEEQDEKMMEVDDMFETNKTTDRVLDQMLKEIKDAPTPPIYFYHERLKEFNKTKKNFVQDLTKTCVEHGIDVGYSLCLVDNMSMIAKLFSEFGRFVTTEKMMISLANPLLNIEQGVENIVKTFSACIVSISGREFLIDSSFHSYSLLKQLFKDFKVDFDNIRPYASQKFAMLKTSPYKSFKFDEFKMWRDSVFKLAEKANVESINISKIQVPYLNLIFYATDDKDYLIDYIQNDAINQANTLKLICQCAALDANIDTSQRPAINPLLMLKQNK